MEIKLKIESSLNSIERIELFLHDLTEKHLINKCQYNSIYLALNEAVNNAIQHGNKYDINKSVKITFQHVNNLYQFIVEDEGIGFDISKIQDPTCNELLHKESGRGIFIMKKYSDGVEFIDKGNIIKLIFNIRGD